MKKMVAGVIAGVLILVPAAADAHEHHLLEIGGMEYEFVIGSLGEPIVVDDKTGVDLRVSTPGTPSLPVAGLEETLKVELIAGNARKVMDFSPVYNVPGSYKTMFYPTVATTLSYRVFGTVNETPVDITFTCSPAGHATAEDDATEVVLSEGVTRYLKSGSFGCPVEKEALGFPEASASVKDLKNNAGENGMATAALVVALAALFGAGVALRKLKKT
jgi:hypothetical protein